MNNQMFPKIKITAEMKERAMSFAKKVTSETFNRFNYDEEERILKIYYGKLGEEVLKSFLSIREMPSKIDYKIYPGTAVIDETDFQINNYKIDIKVMVKDYSNKMLLIVKGYFDNGHQSDFYVAINLFNGESYAIIYGYATKDEVKKAPVNTWHKSNPIKDYSISYNNLHPIENLIIIIKKGCK